MNRVTLATLATAFALSACGSAPDPESRAELADANRAMTTNAATMPMAMPDGSTADGARFALYPGSKLVNAATIMPHEPADMTSFSFWSPAPPTTLRDWYVDELGKSGYKLRTAGSSLIGTDDRGKPFRLDLMAAPGGNAMGVVSKS